MGLVEEDRLHSEVVSQLQVQSERLAVAERNHERLLNRMERRALYKKQISLLQTSISLVNLVTPTSVLPQLTPPLLKIHSFLLLLPTTFKFDLFYL